MRDSKPLTQPAEHDRPFKPTRHVQQPLKLAHEHMQADNHVKKNFRNEDGEVITEPRNFTTMPAKKGNCTSKGATFGGMAEHMADDYNYPKVISRKELDYHLSKLQDVPFKNRARRTPNGNFNSDLQVYDQKPEIKAKPAPERKKNQCELGIHDKPFFPARPPKTGYNKTLEKFPEYKENPLKFISRQPVNEDAPPAWKQTHKHKTRPSPSVQTNLRNLKASFPSVFRR